ncbi:MAG: hypothetical protein RX318_03810 [bacterium]|nr:hypothetical protein [bacterium]
MEIAREMMLPHVLECHRAEIVLIHHETIIDRMVKVFEEEDASMRLDLWVVLYKTIFGGLAEAVAAEWFEADFEAGEGRCIICREVERLAIDLAARPDIARVVRRAHEQRAEPTR